MISNLGLFFALLISSSSAAPGESHQGAPIYLELGEQRTLSLPQLDQYSVSGDAVKYLRLPKKDQLLLKAVKPGLSTLFIRFSGSDSRTHLIRVDQGKGRLHSPELLRALNQIQTSEVIDEGKHLILRGVVDQMREAQAIAGLKAAFPNAIWDETTLESGWLERSISEIKKLLLPYPGLSLTSGEAGIAVRGGLSNPSEREMLIRQIKAIQPLTTIEIQSRSDLDPTLYFKIFLLEVKKEWISQLGLGWPESASGSLNLSPAPFQWGTSLDLTIHALSQKGLARVLSSPELVVKAPGQAELFAGGELPIRERSRFADSVIWKNVGLTLKLDVKEFVGDQVRLSIETEMSHLDAVLKNDNIPGIKTNRIKTLVDSALDQPLLLSGLLQEDLSDTTSGLPALSQIPILGSLFSSQDYQNHRSELVAVLLPHRELPPVPMKRINPNTPKGFIPPFRNRMEFEEIEEAKKQKNYPWNVL